MKVVFIENHAALRRSVGDPFRGNNESNTCFAMRKTANTTDLSTLANATMWKYLVHTHTLFPALFL